MNIDSKDIIFYENKLLIYRIYNIKNNKCYIGKCEKGLNRILDHKKSYNNIKQEYRAKLLYRSMRKYGEEKYSYSIEYIAFNIEDLNKKEKEFISLYKSTDRKFGYNITDGGTGGNTYKYLTKEEKEVSIKKRTENSINSWKNNNDRRTRASKLLKEIRSCPIKSYKNRKIHSKRMKIYNEQNKDNRGVPVLCIETGEVFRNMKLAARFAKKHPSNLREKIAGRDMWTNNDVYTFKYLTNQPVRENKKISRLNKEQIKSIFLSPYYKGIIKHLSKQYNVSETLIFLIRKGKRLQNITKDLK